MNQRRSKEEDKWRKREKKICLSRINKRENISLRKDEEEEEVKEEEEEEAATQILVTSNAKI